MTYDVFISYRRDGGFETACLISEKLKAKGFRVFFDVESMRSGNFNDQLYGVIEKCKDIVVVLPEGGLERCNSPEDWVRKELLHALKHDKNIIPVMLSGFDWPDPMPEGLDTIKVMQAVPATSYEYFDMSVDRIAGYLKSTPNTKLRKSVRWGAIGVAILGVLALIASVVLNHLARPLCTDIVTKLSSQVIVMDSAFTEVDKLLKEWDKTIDAINSTKSQKMVATHTSNLLDYIALAQNNFDGFKAQYENNIISIDSSYERLLLMLTLDLDLNEIIIFNDITNSFVEETERILTYITHALDDEIYNLSTTVEHIDMEKESLTHSFNHSYYCYTYLLSKMPRHSLKSYWELNAIVTHMPSDASIRLSDDEYKLQINREIIALSGIVGKLHNSVAEATDNKELTEQYLAEEVERLNTIFEQMKATYVISAELDYATNFYCILQMAEILEITTEMDKDESYNYLPNRLTGKQVTDHLAKMFSDFVALYPESAAYIPAIKAFYDEVAEGRLNLHVGMSCIGFDGTDTHPALQVGDILLTRNGREITTAEDYVAAGSGKEKSTITLLRLTNGTLKFQTVEFDHNTAPTIGLLPLSNAPVEE